MSVSFQRGNDNEVQKMNSNGKDCDTEIICPIRHFPTKFSPFSLSLKNLLPHFPADLQLFRRFAPIFRPITSLFRRQPSSPISGRTLPPFSGRSPPLSGGDRALLFPAELCLHFSARFPAFSGGDLPYFQQNSPFSGTISTIERALHFQCRPISARLNFLQMVLCK